MKTVCLSPRGACRKGFTIIEVEGDTATCHVCGRVHEWVDGKWQRKADTEGER